MRHGDKINNLGRKKGHRVALLKNLAIALITHKRINTTLAKAKALRLYVEPVITRSKDNTTHSRRVAFSYLNNKEAAKELFDVIGPKVATRPGGYVRIIRTGFRHGDAAETAMIELVDFNDVYGDIVSSDVATTARKTRRSGAKKSVATESFVSTNLEALDATSDVQTSAVQVSEDAELALVSVNDVESVDVVSSETTSIDSDVEVDDATIVSDEENEPDKPSV